MAEVRPDEISAILRKQLSGFESEAEIYVRVPHIKSPDLVPESIPLDILYEVQNLLV